MIRCLFVDRFALLVVLFALAGCGPGRMAFDAAAPTCASPNRFCGGVCVDTTIDRDNCGECGVSCSAGMVCLSGACVAQCPSPQQICGGLCATIATDRLNCGACGTVCPAGQVCSLSRCGVACSAPFTTCQTTATGTDGGAPTRFCAELANDRTNCGACAHRCPDGQLCVNSMCATSCPPTQTACGLQCVDTQTNPAHCGGCGQACAAQQGCVAGACTTSCPATQTFCTDRCTDVQSDATNCGACGLVCPAGQLCVGGACALTCPTDRVQCGNMCLDTTSDRFNCGACTTQCNSGEWCVRGVCSPTCAPGTIACGSECANLTVSVNHCGACATACTGGLLCVGGRCLPTCLSGQARCGTICTDLNVDPVNCGYCGGNCGAGYACVAGACVPLVGTDAGACVPPSQLCGTTCADLQSDNQNCGACGTACAADRTCVQGMCVAPCLTGQTRCGVTCTNTQYDSLNCGTCGLPCPAGLSCGAGVCVVEPTFRVLSLDTTGCNVMEVNTWTGDDRGGIAVSSTTAMLNGDLSLATFGADALANPTSLGARHDSITGDLRDGAIYVFLNAAGVEFDANTTTLGPATQLGVLDPTTGALTSQRVTLSAPVAFNASSREVGIFGGYGRIIVYSGGATGQWFQIRTPSGDVTPLAMRLAPTHTPSESLGFWGIAEYFSGEPHVVFVQNSTTIVRYRISDGMTTNLGTWTSLSDMASITFSISRRRWYFHHEYTSQFRAGAAPDETLGYCDATFDMP